MRSCTENFECVCRLRTVTLTKEKPRERKMERSEYRALRDAISPNVCLRDLCLFVVMGLFFRSDDLERELDCSRTLALSQASSAFG